METLKKENETHKEKMVVLNKELNMELSACRYNYLHMISLEDDLGGFDVVNT